MKFAEFSALKTLLDSDINMLPLTDTDLEKLLNRQGCKIRSFSLDDENSVHFLSTLDIIEFAERYEAFTYVESDEIIVFYNATIQAARRRFAFAHELAHLKLGHTAAAHKVLGFHDNFLPDLTQEEEANAFALALLAPPCVLQRSNIVDIGRISHFTLLNNYQSSQVCRNLHNKKDLNEVESALCTQFSAFIRKNNRKYYSKLRAFGLSMFIVTLIIGIICICSLYISSSKQINSQITPILTPSTSVFASPVPVEANGKTVAVTKRGKRYHLPDCSYVENKTNITLYDIQTAISKGYTPCERCNP